MPSFSDTTGREWTVKFDGLLLSALRAEHKIDLADVSGDTYARLERDDALLTVAVCFLCREQLKAAQLTQQHLASALHGEALESAMQAVWGAAKVFFRPRLWSALESACRQHRESLEKWEALRPAMLMLNQPDMPAAMREAVMETLGSLMQGMSASDSESSAEKTSAGGPVAIPSIAACTSQEPAASSPAA